MGSSQFAIPPQLRGEWSEVQRGNECLIVNSITHEQFLLVQLPKRPGVAGRVYTQRSIYPIPHSPKLLMIDESPETLTFLVQRPQSSLKYLLRKKSLLLEVLQVLRELLGVAQQLSEKYGGFGVSEGMVGVLQSGEVVMWVNESWQENSIQVALRGDRQTQQETMILQLLAMSQKHTQFDLGFLTKQYAGPLTFSQFSKHLAVKMQVEKFKLVQMNLQLNRSSEPTIPPPNAGKTLVRNYTLTQLKMVEPAAQLTEKKGKELKRHRRNLTQLEGKGSSLKSHSKSKGREDPFSPQRTTSPKVSVFSQTSNSIKMVKSLEKCKASFGSPQQLRGTTGSALDGKDISFSKAHPHPHASPKWTKRQSKPKPDNIITRSSEETNSDEVEEKEGRRESSIRWAEEDTGGCCRSIEDYQCLLRNPRGVFRKVALNSVQQQIIGGIEDD